MEFRNISDVSYVFFCRDPATSITFAPKVTETSSDLHLLGTMLVNFTWILRAKLGYTAFVIASWSKYFPNLEVGETLSNALREMVICQRFVCFTES